MNKPHHLIITSNPGYLNAFEVNVTLMWNHTDITHLTDDLITLYFFIYS